MKPFKLTRTWLLIIRGISLIVLGVLSIVQKPNTMQPLLLVFALLLGFTVFIQLLEVFALKREKLRGFVALNLFLSLLFLVLFFIGFNKYESSTVSVDSARSFALLIILLTLFTSCVGDLIEWFVLYNKKHHFSGIYLINAILTLMVALFFYSFTNGVDEVRLRLFGYMSTGAGFIFIIIYNLVSGIEKEYRLKKND